MGQAELIDEHVSANQCKLAVEALLKHEQKRQEKLQESQLLPGKEQNVWLQVTVKQMHPEKKFKPHKIPIVHPLVDPRTSQVCLISKDPQREYKDLLEEHKIRFISRVVGLEKLKGKFKGYEARRLLLKENELFLADERVVPLLPKLLGSKFFEAKKQPIPVNLTRKDLKGELERAISSTYFHQNQGTCSSIKVGLLSQTSTQVFANLKTALPAIVKAIKGGWENIQSLNIKTNTSVALPIWTCDLGAEEGGRWDGLADVEMEDDEGDSEDESSDEEKTKTTKDKSTKGKKRAAADEDGDEEQPKKKAKSSLTDASSKRSDKQTPTSTKTPTKASKAAPDVASEEPKVKAKAKKEKPTDKRSEAELPSSSSTGPSASATDPAAVTKAPDADLSSKKKKRKAQLTSDSTAATTTEAPQTQKSNASESTSTTASTFAPATPSASKKKKARAQATDFFDDAQSTPAAATQVAPPPNTPAEGLSASAQTPAATGKKRKGKKVEQTPVSSAIEKLVEQAEPAPSPATATVSSDAVDAADKPQKKPRHKKKKADAQDEASTTALLAEEPSVVAAPVAIESASAAAGDGEKKKRKKKKQADAATDADALVPVPAATKPPTPDAAAVTVGDVKQKRSTSGVEKKKEKAVKAKRSAKDALIGKKGLV